MRMLLASTAALLIVSSSYPTGCIDEKFAVEFGKMLSVQRIVISSIGLVGRTYTLQMRLLDVESSRNTSAWSGIRFPSP